MKVRSAFPTGMPQSPRFGFLDCHSEQSEESLIISVTASPGPKTRDASLRATSQHDDKTAIFVNRRMPQKFATTAAKVLMLQAQKCSRSPLHADCGISTS